MSIRPAEPGDYRAIHEVLLDAFPSPDEADLVVRLRRDGDCAIELVAEDGGRIIAHILFSPMTAPFRALALGPVAVVWGCRVQGFGSALIRAGHDKACKQGWDAIFVLGDPNYYRRFGYDPVLAAGFASPYAGPHFMARALEGVLPVTEGEVSYAPAFAALG